MTSSAKGKIGIFDSGLGGLAILHSILNDLPQYNYLYLGDNARVPYGGRSANAIYFYTEQAVNYLFAQDCELIILACNTASAVALRKLQKEYLPSKYPDRRILGVIRPTVETVVESGYSSVGVIGTYATVNSLSFEHEIHKLDRRITVSQQPAPLLVPIIEEGKLNWQGLDLIIEEYLQPLVLQNVEALILGCTHYGLISERLQNYVGQNIKVLSEGPIVALKLIDYLERHPELENKLAKNGERTYRVTDYSERYEKIAGMFLGENFTNGKKLELVDF